MNADSIRSARIKMSLFIFLYFFTWSSSFSLYAIWLGQTMGLDSMTIGGIFAANGVCAVLLKPVYGYIMDRIGMSKRLLYFVCITSALMMPFFEWVYRPLLLSHLTIGILVGAVYLALGWYAGVSCSESYTDRFSRLYGLEFGRIRMWGSLGWATAAALSGLLFNITPVANFSVSSVTAIVMLFILLSLKIGDEQLHRNSVIADDKISMTDLLVLFKTKQFWTFALFVAGVTWMMFVAEQQFPRYFVTFFATKEQGNAWYGYLGTLQSGVEFLMMMCLPTLVNRIGCKNGLVLCGCIVGVRLIASGLTDDPLIISIIKPFYGVEMAILLISVFKYISINFDKKVNATMFLLGYQAVVYLGSIFVAPVTGYAYGTIGFEKTYLIMGLCALFFTAVSYFTLSPNRSVDEKHLRHAVAVKN